jgi:clan AA aspartic protease
MTFGAVVNLEARAAVVFRLTGQLDRSLECVIDTGCQGELALPLTTVAALGLPAGGRIWANLADGTDVPVPVFDAVIIWDERERGITVMGIGKRPLIGTELLEGFNRSADFEPDGQVALTPL